MPGTPPLLIDTTSLLRANPDGFQYADDYSGHSSLVAQSLILFERILLDGPSIDRNSDRLQWLADVDDSVEILHITQAEQTALYRSAEVLARQMHSTPEDFDFMRIQMPYELNLEIEERAFSPSTNWHVLQRDISSEDLRQLHQVLSEVFGPNVPYSGTAFVALARTLYYLCLQESVHSSLLLDPLKALDIPAPSNFAYAKRILDMFDNEVGEAFRERKRKWLGTTPRTLRPPLLMRYIQDEAERRGWSIGRVILWMRESREVQLFRKGLSDLQDAIDSNDSTVLDAIFADLDAAAAAWSKQLGAGYNKHSDITVSVTLPFVGIAKTLPLPRLPKRSTSNKLLIFVGQLLAAV